MNLWTIAPEHDFLSHLAGALSSGALLGTGKDVPLSQWTVLLPTRRAARAFSDILLQRSGRKAVLLPRIRPIGDIDEDTLADTVATDDVPAALPKAHLLHLLLGLLRHWAEANPQSPLASDVLASPSQALQLALSLEQLLMQAETEERNFARLPELFGHELAVHRTSILGLLDVLVTELPQRLHALGLSTTAARRNRLLRLEAQRIAQGFHPGPIVAAGSTGTNPAARALLHAIALQPLGAVVLPGLDLDLPDEAWSAITAQHPQAALKQLIDEWSVPRTSVKVLGPAPAARSLLLSAMMRPAQASDAWRDPALAEALPQAMAGIVLAEAMDRHEEAMVIALRLKQHLAEADGPAALITPDRELALRVTAALQRWNIAIDDSGGRSLAGEGLGSLLVMLIRARMNNFSAETVLALLRHPFAGFGRPSAEAASLAGLIEISCYRGQPAWSGISDIPARIATAREAAKGPHAHPLIKAVTDSQWEALADHGTRIAAVLAPVAAAMDTLAGHVSLLRTMLDGMAPQAMEDATLSADLLLLLESLAETPAASAHLSFQEVAPVLLHHLAVATLRPPLRQESRLHILGLLEARLVPLSLAILGGLNDGVWPQQTDTGPWLNRTMRDVLGLSHPERDIGLTAHDFVQGLGRPEVMVTWSARLGGKPALPSRWVLRLRAVLELHGLASDRHLSPGLAAVARQLDEPHGFSPVARPAAAPPVAARPLHFSATEVEKLVRDSYHIFARRILGLYPVAEVSEELDGGLRGSLIHQAFHHWIHDPYEADDQANLERLLQRGREAFAPWMTMPEVSHLWWPRFEAMAKVHVLTERLLHDGLLASHTEIRGEIDLPVSGIRHTLSARADRIDLLANGTLRILDYKSGQVPSQVQVETGFAPQLTLEAAIAQKGGFKALGPRPVHEAAYVQVGGGKTPAAYKPVTASATELASLSATQLAQLQALLAAYQHPATAYRPRHNMEKEEDPSDYDHLSRWFEWRLQSGSAS